MTKLNELGLAAARDALLAREANAYELTEACLLAIESASKLNAFLHVTPETALDRATTADQQLASGDAPALCGLPIGIKDLFCTKDVPTQAGSRILEGFTPPYESTVSQKLLDAGAIMLGKLNMDEFAMGSSNETSFFGEVVNPWRRKNDECRLTPGGSSGGSAAAVAADLCLAATGTDTGGSIRQPASFCGITGIKPTYGRCSRWGIVAFASSLDQAGPITKTVRDAAIMLTAMCGHDAKDSTSVDIPVPNFEAALSGDIRRKTIGIPKEYLLDQLPNEIATLWTAGRDILAAAGAKIVDISLPHTEFALPTYYVIAPAEASSNLARYDGVRFGRRAQLAPGDSIVDMYEKTRAEGFGAEVKRRLMVGTYVLSAGFYDAHYNRARKVRSLIKKDFEDVFSQGIDAILTPSTPSAAFELGDSAKTDPVQMYLNDIFTVTVNLAGLPAISVPTGTNSEGLPLGLQLIGQPWQEDELLNLAFVLEQSAGFQDKPKCWW
ncbi:MAG: Asp-tRNA(Asn)/Glu-tRNA(Gln) amidotransferase subunit GatA [Aestuariivita sp.]|nr:Asp-tRNA(Asn)/Glu-tRNA(Gln) amidotransferase subunit GatA [Aestuariivita sp.]MCY4202892.1 Asp-tRNA(Asn)/Glu-tRNA(Gln) amidotransferase subunit GatA [Aestuariivita sp.]